MALVNEWKKWKIKDNTESENKMIMKWKMSTTKFHMLHVQNQLIWCWVEWWLMTNHKFQCGYKVILTIYSMKEENVINFWTIHTWNYHQLFKLVVHCLDCKDIPLFLSLYNSIKFHCPPDTTKKFCIWDYMSSICKIPKLRNTLVNFGYARLHGMLHIAWNNCQSMENSIISIHVRFLNLENQLVMPFSLCFLIKKNDILKKW